jgi:type IV pilus assembly protein PilA
MFKLLKNMKKNKKGYTLTELIIVIAILGILAAIATPATLGYINDAKTKTDMANAKVIEDAISRAIVLDDTINLSTATSTNLISYVNTQLGGSAAADVYPTIQKNNDKFILNRQTGKVSVATSVTDVTNQVDITKP